MLRIIIALIVFAIADDACAKETVMRQHISGLPRRVMREHMRYNAKKMTRPSITKQTD